jgi:hypothetical protein
MNSTYRLRSAAQKVAPSLTRTQSRSKAYVKSYTEKPYNTSHLNFEPVHPLIQQARANEIVGSVVTYLKDVQAFQLTADFKTFANRLLNKDYKDAKLLVGEFDMTDAIPSGDFKPDSALINAVHSQETIRETEDFFAQKPYLNSVALDLFLELNPKYFKEVKEKRAEHILNWAISSSEVSGAKTKESRKKGQK